MFRWPMIIRGRRLSDGAAIELDWRVDAREGVGKTSRRSETEGAAMSWDIFAQDIPADAHKVTEIPDDFEPRPLGSRKVIAARIRAIVATVEFQDSGWGTVDEPGCSMEINLGSSEIVTAVAFHVYGGELAPGIVADLLEQFGWRALDPASESGFFDSNGAASSYARWRQYRDRVIENH